MGDALEFWSSEYALGLRVPLSQMRHIVRLCVESGDIETGGILAGRYSGDRHCAVVKHASGKPSGSKGGRTRFVREVGGLQAWLDALWERRHKQYYLGEWHYHPDAATLPSPNDTVQMTSIADSIPYHCPVPVLLIVDRPAREKWTTSAYAFRRGRAGAVTLHAEAPDLQFA